MFLIPLILKSLIKQSQTELTLEKFCFVEGETQKEENTNCSIFINMHEAQPRG